MLINITHAQSDETYDFKQVRQLQRQTGLQDPFLKPDGERVSTKEEWAVQRQYIISMLEHYQYGEMPPVPKDVIVKETLSEDIYDGSATRKLYTLTMKRNGKCRRYVNAIEIAHLKIFFLSRISLFYHHIYFYPTLSQVYNSGLIHLHRIINLYIGLSV